MAYTPENNPYIPGDPYSYDLKWMAQDIKHMEEQFGTLDESVETATEQAANAKDEADRAKDEADRAADKANDAADSASDAHDSELAAKNYADNIADPVSGIVTDWLNDHITQPTTPVVDTSLLIPGAAADSEVVGNHFRNDEFFIENIANKPLEAADVITGIGLLMDGSTFASASWNATDYIDISGSIYGRGLRIYSSLIGLTSTVFYDKDKNVILGINGNTAGNYGYNTGTEERIYEIPQDAKYIRATIYANDYTQPSDLNLGFIDLPEYSNILDIVNNGVGYDNMNAEMQNAFVPVFTPQTLAFTNTDHFARYDNGLVVSYIGVDCTDYVSFSGSYVKISGSNTGSCPVIVFYDEAKQFISALPNVDTPVVYENDVFAVPAGAAYFIANNYLDQTRVEVLSGYEATETRGKWKDIVWTCFGDSLTAINAPTNKRYFDYINDMTGIQIVNMGDSGTGYAKEAENNRAFYQRISNVPSCDVITIFGSFNDMAAGLPLGTETDSGTATLAGCMNTTFDNLFSILPTVQLGVISPTPWETLNPLGQPNSASEYCDMLKAICSRRGIPYLDLFHCSGLRPWEASYRTLVYSKDNGMGIHPNELGHQIISSHIEAFLDELLIH